MVKSINVYVHVCMLTSVSITFFVQPNVTLLSRPQLSSGVVESSGVGPILPSKNTLDRYLTYMFRIEVYLFVI